MTAVMTPVDTMFTLHEKFFALLKAQDRQINRLTHIEEGPDKGSYFVVVENEDLCSTVYVISELTDNVTVVYSEMELNRVRRHSCRNDIDSKYWPSTNFPVLGASCEKHHSSHWRQQLIK